MNDMATAALVRRIRAQARLTQAELAARAGTAQPAIARLEAGRSSPSLATLENLAAAAGFDLELRLAPRASVDPVIARYGKDIDRTLLRRNLTLSVDQRIRELARLQEFDAEVRRAVREARRDMGRRR